jgi:(p)ppGpp synthase/HD superfamily hydrolase
MTRIDEAIALAVEAHSNQKLDEDGMPHIVHCMEVMHIVKKWCEDHIHSVQTFYPAQRALKKYTIEELLIATILHDAVEDSEGKVTLSLILEKFGENVHRLVDGVTRRGLGEGETKEDYRDFIYRAKTDPGTLLIKSADLQHNRGRAFHIKQAKWRDKLSFKYRVASLVLSTDPDYQPTWEQASMSWVNGDDGEHFYIADPNGKRIEISKAQVEALQAEWKNRPSL